LCLRLVSTNSRTLSVPRSRLGTRNIHKRIPLPYSIKDGLGNFLPPAALQTLVEYQDGLLSRLNEEVRADSKQENHASVVHTAIKYANQRKRTLAFNYAVLALNNSFFLSQLSPPHTEADHQSKISVRLAEKIRLHYGDLPKLKSSFSAAALGMFSNGWVWFVTDTGGELGVLPTFGPSTLLIRSRQNMNYANGRVLGEDDVEDQTPPPLPASSSSPYSKTPPPPSLMPSSAGLGSLRPTAPPLNRSIHSVMDTAASGIYDSPNITETTRPVTASDRLQNVGSVIYPLFCIPVYEHAWMSAGFGVWGKEDWLKEFWTVLDWEKVSKAYEHAQKGGTLI